MGIHLPIRNHGSSPHSRMGPVPMEDPRGRDSDSLPKDALKSPSYFATTMLGITAKSLAEHIKSSHQTLQKRARVRILTSPFQRTLNTASIIKTQFRTSFSSSPATTTTTPEITLEAGLYVTPDLRERFFGEFEMQTPSDHLYNRVWAADAQDPFHELFDVESVADVTKRVTAVIRAQEGRQEDDEGKEEEEEVWVVLVSHGDSLQILQTAMRGWSGDRHRQLEHLETANWRVVEWCPELQAAHQSSRS
ncbi:hypothetical protein BGZ96_008353 [Linnemannia gamsii]|uniref:Phosphoglycerate mutase-like protein n=1 Tax=Linnemannia gamsii TaxID=64522 RepID=A0ABQ7JZH6_9FUNG|nr:hypothetical protein BGZ96_008353 [Linnemannia gamsii]